MLKRRRVAFSYRGLRVDAYASMPRIQPCWLPPVEYVMVARRSGTSLDRESVRVRLPGSLTRRLGNAMRASQKPKRKKAKANRKLAYVSSILSMAARNLVNMAASTVVSGTVLLALLAAR